MTIYYIMLKLIITSIRGLSVVTLTCFDVANYFLSLPNEDIGDSITNLKLQKLVYYSQGFSLALYGKPLFVERMEAWEHGPVAPALYNKYKPLGAMPIPIPEDIDFSKCDEQTKGLLNGVYEEYGQFSAWKLCEMSHKEEPWVKGKNRASKIIQNSDLKKYFSTLVEDV